VRGILATKKHHSAALVATFCVVLAILSGCGGAASAGTSSTGNAPATPRATHAPAKPTGTMNTGGTPTIGGPVADFQKQLRSNGNCPGSAAGPDCFCGSVGDGSCEYTVTVTVADGAVNKIVLQGLAKQETWDVSFTFTWCSQYMGGATVAAVGGQVSGPGGYNFDLGSRTVHLLIVPKTCDITID
jgi:hypothetical protein